MSQEEMTYPGKSPTFHHDIVFPAVPSRIRCINEPMKCSLLISRQLRFISVEAGRRVCRRAEYVGVDSQPSSTSYSDGYQQIRSS